MNIEVLDVLFWGCIREGEKRQSRKRSRVFYK